MDSLEASEMTVVTGPMNEDTAVECMKTGAWGCIIKRFKKEPPRVSERWCMSWQVCFGPPFRLFSRVSSCPDSSLDRPWLWNPSPGRRFPGGEPRAHDNLRRSVFIVADRYRRAVRNLPDVTLSRTQAAGNPRDFFGDVDSLVGVW
jgi:hypothetical protein